MVGAYLGVGEGVLDLVLPVAVESTQDIFLGDVLDSRYIVIVGVVLEDYAGNFVLGLAEPSFLEVMEDAFHPGFLACNKTRVCHRDGK